MIVTLDVKVKDILEAVKFEAESDLKQFVFDLDLQVADAGFTEDLIFGLVKSLMGDLDEKDKEDLKRNLTCVIDKSIKESKRNDK